MAKFIAISGPSHSGKSTLSSILANKYSDQHRIAFVEDLQDRVWKRLVDKCGFLEFHEVYEDRDYLFMYISQIISELESVIKSYEKFDDVLVVLDGSPLDYLIYSILHMWYYYPASEIQEKYIIKLLNLQSKISQTYMVYADDEAHPVGKGTTLRQRMTDYKRNRLLEISLYDSYRKRTDITDLFKSVSESKSVLSRVIDDFLET